MKLLKKITAVMAALMIVVNISVVNTFAVSVAPIVGAELEEILAALLLGAGHSQSDIDGMSVTQMQSLVTDDLNSGKITFDTPIYDPVTGATLSFYDYMNKPENKVARDILATATNNFIYDVLNPSDNSHGGGGSAGTRDEAVSNYFIATSTIDYRGYGAVVERTNIKTGEKKYYYCDYVVISDDDLHFTTCVTHLECNYYPSSNKLFEYAVNGTTFKLAFDRSNFSYKFCGDVRYDDDTPAPTDDSFEYQLGEAAGTKVTPDMVNPDGTVTIDGVTYYPVDYIDPDKLTEDGKKQIVQNITNVINNTYVISDNKPIVDTNDITVEVPEDLEDFKISSGIATVFPFCLPFDFVRGMKILVQKPKVPVFKTELDLTNFCGYDLGKHTIEISLEKWEPAAVIFRWFSLLLFTYTLILLSGKIVKGAGS